MKDFEKTKRFNVEDITINNKSSDINSSDNVNDKNKANNSSYVKKPVINVTSGNFLNKNDNVDSALEKIVKNDFQEETIVQMEMPKQKTIGIASDHRGYKLKQKLTKYLGKKGYTVIDFGTDSVRSSDYPEFGFKLGEAVANFEVEKGIAICGSGIGISIACNKIKGVRCAKVDNVRETKYSRKDNDANIIAIAGNIPLFRAKDIVDAYLKTEFSGLVRHRKRIIMLNNRG